MAPAKSTALTKRPSNDGLMAPPPPPKRIKRPPKVLDEDIYTSSLSHIIARDFFPGLLESETQQEYLDALESDDQAWVDEAEARVRAVMTPGPEGRRMRGKRGVSMTPLPVLMGSAAETPRSWRGDTPGSVRSSRTSQQTPQRGVAGDRSREEEKVDLSLGLSAFQAKYTSEDNESFNKLLDKQNAKHAEKYKWIWNGNKLPSKRQIAQEARQQKLLDMAASDERDGSTNADRQVILRDERSQDMRKAMIDVLQPQPKNSFMFSPDSLDDTHPQLQTTAQVAQEKSRAGPAAVSYDNTRLPLAPSSPTEDDLLPPSPSLSAIDAAIAGHHRVSSMAPSVVTGDGSETPRVNGYGFVDAEPTPSEMGVAVDEPRESLLSELLKARGEEDLTPNPFTINESNRRERLHHAMVDKAAKTKRSAPSVGRLAQLRKDDGKTPTPKFMSSPHVGGSRSEGTGGLTPAAQKLFGRISNTPGRTGSGIGAGGAFDGGAKKKQAWTPTPVRRSKA